MIYSHSMPLRGQPHSAAHRAKLDSCRHYNRPSPYHWPLITRRYPLTLCSSPTSASIFPKNSSPKSPLPHAIIPACCTCSDPPATTPTACSVTSPTFCVPTIWSSSITLASFQPASMAVAPALALNPSAPAIPHLAIFSTDASRFFSPASFPPDPTIGNAWFVPDARSA